MDFQGCFGWIFSEHFGDLTKTCQKKTLSQHPTLKPIPYRIAVQRLTKLNQRI